MGNTVTDGALGGAASTSNVAAAPKVSVCVITHNHERFLHECLESIMQQEVDFEFEVIIADDLSSDRTREIATDFARRFASRVRLLLPSTKLGPAATFISLHDAALGEYTAHIDGDDMMLPGRLKAQSEFLDLHPECAFVGHDVRVVSRVNGEVISESFISRPIPEVTDLTFLLTNGCFFAHSSKMYRRSANYNWDRNEPIVDFNLHVGHALVGKVGYIDRVLGIYRKGEGSISNVDSPFHSEVIQGHLRAFSRALENGLPADLVHSLMAQYKYVNGMHYLRNNHLDLFRELIRLDAKLRPHATIRHLMMARVAPFGALPRWLAWLFDSFVSRRRGTSA